MRHKMLTQRAPFCIGAMAKKGTLSQHFVTHVVPPLAVTRPLFFHTGVARARLFEQRLYIPYCGYGKGS